MVQVKINDQELFEEIKKESGGKFESFQGIIKIPKSMEKRIISRYHDDVKEGHQGLARTMEKIQRDFYIPGLTRKIKKYIDKCEECQTNKHDNRRPFGKMTIEKETPTRPWQHLAMDFMAMPAEKERKQILVESIDSPR